MAFNRVFLVFILATIVCLKTNANEPLVILNEDNYFPFSGSNEGISVEIVKLAYSRAGTEVTFKSLPFARLVKMVENGSALGGLNIIKEGYAKDKFLFPRHPIMRVHTHYFYNIKAPLKAKKLKDLDNKELVVGEVLGFMYAQHHLDRTFTRLKSNSEEQLLSMLKHQRLDAAYITKELACFYSKQNNSPLLADYGFLRDVGAHNVDMYLAFNKSHEQAVEAAALFDKGMDIIIKSGELNALLSKYLGKACL